MSFLKRVLLYVTSLLVVTVLITATVIGISAVNAVRTQATQDAQLITEQFNRAVVVGEEIEIELTDIFAQQAQAEGFLSSILPALAEALQMPEPAVAAKFAEMTGQQELLAFKEQRMGQSAWLGQFVDRLLGEDVSAIWIVTSGLDEKLFQAVPEWENRELREVDRRHLEQAMATQQQRSYFEANTLFVATPLIDSAGEVVGGTLLVLPVERVARTIRQLIGITTLTACGVLAGGVLVSVILARRVTQPTTRLTAAAAAVENATYESGCLAEVAGRSDELGQLARVFERMADEVYAREQRLKKELQELRIDLDAVKRSRSVAEITDTDFFRDLQSKAQAMRGTREGAPSEGKEL